MVSFKLHIYINTQNLSLSDKIQYERFTLLVYLLDWSIIYYFTCSSWEISLRSYSSITFLIITSTICIWNLSSSAYLVWSKQSYLEKNLNLSTHQRDLFWLLITKPQSDQLWNWIRWNALWKNIDENGSIWAFKIEWSHIQNRTHYWKTNLEATMRCIGHLINQNFFLWSFTIRPDSFTKPLAHMLCPYGTKICSYEIDKKKKYTQMESIKQW